MRFDGFGGLERGMKRLVGEGKDASGVFTLIKSRAFVWEIRSNIHRNSVWGRGFQHGHG